MRAAASSSVVAVLVALASTAACGGSSTSDVTDLSTPPPSGTDGDPSGTDAAGPGVGSDGGANPPGDGGGPDADTPAIGGGRGDSCATATRIFAADVSLKGQTTVGYERKYAGCYRMRGRDRIYGVQVPPGKRVRARVQSTQAGYEPEIHAVAGPEIECNANPLECIANTKAGTWLMWTNKDPVAREVFLIVDTDDVADPGGSFDLDVHVEALPAGETCRTAPLVAVAPGASVKLTGSTELYMADYSTGEGCDFISSAPDRVFAVDIPSGQKLSATLEVAPETAVAFNLMADQPGTCDATVACFSGDWPSSSASTVSVAHANRTGATRRVHLVAKARGTYDEGYIGKPFTLDVALAPVSAAAGESCESAIALTSGVALDAESSVGFDDDFGPIGYVKGCAGKGGEKVYQLSVAAGQELSVTVTPAVGSSFDPALDVTVGAPSACSAAPRVCVRSRDVAGPGLAETLTWKNETGAATTAFVVVSDSSSPRTGAVAGGGQYSIVASLTP